jgi:hypothetical protein
MSTNMQERIADAREILAIRRRLWESGNPKDCLPLREIVSWEQLLNLHPLELHHCLQRGSAPCASLSSVLNALVGPEDGSLDERVFAALVNAGFDETDASNALAAVTPFLAVDRG